MMRWYQAPLYPRAPFHHALARTGAYAAVTAAVVFILQHALGVIHWSAFGANLLVGAMMSAAAWGTVRLLDSMMPKMTIEPSSLRGFVLRLPFLYVAGGIGYTSGMVIAKKIGLAGFYDIPIQPVFVFGARTEILLLLALQLFSYYRLAKNTG